MSDSCKQERDVIYSQTEPYPGCKQDLWWSEWSREQRQQCCDPAGRRQQVATWMTDNWAIGEQSTESRRWEGRTYTSVTLEQIDHQGALDVFIGRINHVCSRTAEHTSYVIPGWCIYIYFFTASGTKQARSRGKEEWQIRPWKEEEALLSPHSKIQANFPWQRFPTARKRDQGELEVRRPDRDHKVNTAGLPKTASATILIVSGLRSSIST